MCNKKLFSFGSVFSVSTILVPYREILETNGNFIDSVLNVSTLSFSYVTVGTSNQKHIVELKFFKWNFIRQFMQMSFYNNKHILLTQFFLIHSYHCRELYLG